MMTLRKKTFIIIILVVAFLIAVIWFFSHVFLLRSFALLEEKHAAENVARGLSALDNEFSDLDSIAGDWALWDDSYRFIQDGNSQYIDANLPDSTLANLKLNFMIFMDGSGHVVYSKGLDLVNSTEIPVPGSLEEYIKSKRYFFLHSNIHKTNSGFLGLPEGILLVASRPITTSDEKGPAAGNLILGRYLNSQEVNRLSEITHLSFIVRPLNGEPEGKQIAGSGSTPVFLLTENERMNRAWTYINDISGKPIAALELMMPREFYARGKATVFYMVLSLALIGTLVTAVTLVLLEKLVLSRLVGLGAAVSRIGVNGDHSSRVFVQGNDELLMLGNRINEMLESLEKSQKELVESEEKFRNIYDQLPIGLILFDADGFVTEVNQAFLEIFGMDKPEDIIGHNICEDPNLKDVDQGNLFQPQVMRFEFEYDFDLIGKTGVYHTSKSGKAILDWVVNPFKMSSLSFQGFLGQIQDVTQRKQAEEQLKYLSLYDNLSGLYNRAFFEEQVRQFESQGFGPMCVIMCDVDGLKLANDTFGHDAGDRLLKAAAQVLKDCFRKEDIVARIGGDEYAVLLPGADLSTAEKICERIQASVESYNQTYQSAVPLSLSLGLAATKSGTVKISDLLKEADYNMYLEKLHHRQSNKNDLVQTLAKALKARDIMTQWHGEHLGNLVVDLAKAVGLQESCLADLRLFAQFHDIGKVGIPDSILFKPEKLTEREFAEMQRHCEIGFRIAQSSQDLLPIADWILHHHEWWNGGGYPFGLKGEQIPLQCRILSLADAYDAMINDRPYRKAYSHEKAKEEIRNRSGSQFDPNLVKIFLSILDKEEGESAS